MSKVQEQNLKPTTRVEFQNQQVREETRTEVGSLGIQTSASAVREFLLSQNRIALGRGDYGGFTFTREGTVLAGVAPGARVVRPVTLDSTCTLTGLEFELTTPIVIGAEAKVIFNGCIFYLRTSDSDTMITLESGGMAVFVGCTFRSDDTLTGPCIDVQSTIATDCHVIGSCNLTGGTLGTVTSTGVI